MSALIAIRTNRWTAAEERLLAALREVQGRDVAVVFHDRPADLQPPAPVVDLTDDWVRARGLRLTDDYGWRCGDYAYYALREAMPGHDHYWLVEPDVHFTASPAPFFAAFETVGADALGLDVQPVQGNNRFARGLPKGLLPYRAIFALTRFSGRALDRLLQLRRDSAAAGVRAWAYANDEFFVFSHVKADPELTVAGLEEIAPAWFEGASFRTDPDVLLEAIPAVGAGQGRVFHPVRDRASFKAALAGRLTKRINFLDVMGDSLAGLSEADVDDVVATAADRLRREILARRGAHLASEREAQDVS